MTADSEGQTGAGVLEMRPASQALAPFVSAFAHRDEVVDGGVVRVLPELRPSVQLMLADPYWIRDRAPGALWRRLPAVALWAPRFDWAYGFAARRIKAVGFALTVDGFKALAPAPAPQLVGRIVDLEPLHPRLAGTLRPAAGEAFDDWVARASDVLGACFATARKGRDFSTAIDMLATSDGGAVARAAGAAGVSERQFRRIFHDAFGVSPKRYQRALRIDRMIRHLHPAAWEKDAHDGAPVPFADQPHAIREFRDMIGVTPADYAALKRRGDRTLRSLRVIGVEPPSDDDAARC